LSPVGALPAARDGLSTVYDPNTNRMIVYGGFGNGAPGGDMWVLSNADGTGGAPAWTQLIPAYGASPTGGSSQTAVYDPVTNTMTVYGGFDGHGDVAGDAWVLSNANGLGGTPAWKQVLGTPAFPSPRLEHSAVYIASTNQMVVFGGKTALGGVTLSDTWVLSHANGL
jgi:hypothetical protein